MQQLPIHVLLNFPFFVLNQAFLLSPYHGPWSPVMKANSYVRSTIFKYLHLGKNLSYAPIFNLQNGFWLFNIANLSFNRTMYNRKEDKKMLSTITYMLKYLTLSVNHIGLTLSMTILASLIISVAGQPLQKCFGYRLPHLTVQNKNIISLFPLSRSQCTSQIDMNYDKHAFNKV